MCYAGIKGGKAVITITTKRGKQVKLLDMAEWWESIYQHHPHSKGIMLLAFEQGVWQSQQYKVCIECLSKDNLVECENHLLATDGFHSKDYYMCQKCLDYYNNKG